MTAADAAAADAGAVDAAPRAGCELRWLPAAAVVGSALIVLAPLLRPGYVLVYDMVFTTDPPIDDATLGLGSQLPRAVPSDLVVALLAHVLPGDAVQKIVLAALVLGAGFGAARLCGSTPLARSAAALAYVWTPYLAERLLIGQWAVLAGWAVLPWALAAATDRARARPGSLARTVLAVGIAALAGAPALVVVVPTVLTVLLWPGRRPASARRSDALAVAGAAAIAALVWALPALLRPGGLGADPRGATVFAPRADTPLGIVLSLLGGGGIWNADTVPPLRSGLPSALGSLAVVALAAAGLARRRDSVTAPLACTAGSYLALVCVTVWPAGARALARVPGGALLRDSQRLVVPAVLLFAIGFGSFVEHAVAAARRHGGRQAPRAAALLVLAPVAVLPSLAWGVSGRLATVQYPREYQQVRALLRGDDRPGAVFVLPAAPYRAFGWNGYRTQLDPLPRVLTRPTVLAAELAVLSDGRPVVVRDEDRLAARLAAGAGRGTLAAVAARSGVRYVVADEPVTSSEVAGLRSRFAGRYLHVWEVPHVSAERARHPYRGYAASRAPVLAVDVAVAFLAVVATLTWCARTALSRLRNRC